MDRRHLPVRRSSCPSDPGCRPSDSCRRLSQAITIGVGLLEIEVVDAGIFLITVVIAVRVVRAWSRTRVADIPDIVVIGVILIEVIRVGTVVHKAAQPVPIVIVLSIAVAAVAGVSGPI